MKAREPFSIKTQTIPDRLCGRASCPFLEAFQASNAVDDHQHQLPPGILDVMVANRKAFLEEIFLHSVDKGFHFIDRLWRDSLSPQFFWLLLDYITFGFTSWKSALCNECDTSNNHACTKTNYKHLRIWLDYLFS